MHPGNDGWLPYGPAPDVKLYPEATGELAQKHMNKSTSF